MISRRNSGLTSIQGWLVVIWALGWFALNLVAGESIGRISYNQTNFGVYFLGVLLATLIRGGNVEEISFLKGSSDKWLGAINRSNKDLLFILIVLFAIVFATKDKGISRVFLTTYLVTLWPTLVLVHRYTPVLISTLLFGKTQRFVTVVVGTNTGIRSVTSFINDLPRSGLDVVGTVSPEAEEESEEDLFPVLGNLETFESVLNKYAVDQVIIVNGEKDREWYNKLFRVCDQFGCHVMVYNFWQEYFDQPVHFTKHGVHTFFTLQDEPLQNPINRLIKRSIDVAVSLPVVFFVLPVMCIWVKFMQTKQSPGPLFFRQYRSGFQKQRFKIYKFRSMDVDPIRSQEAKQATKGDGRVFSFGAFMRRRSIDEFPQFINVLKGDMSLVGPRPHLVDHDESFSKVVGTYRLRHFVKPGLTGLAQVNGFRGEVVDPEAIQNRIRMDISYINSWSFGLDIDLIFRTIGELLRPSDTAY